MRRLSLVVQFITPACERLDIAPLWYSNCASFFLFSSSSPQDRNMLYSSVKSPFLSLVSVPVAPPAVGRYRSSQHMMMWDKENLPLQRKRGGETCSIYIWKKKSSLPSRASIVCHCLSLTEFEVFKLNCVFYSSSVLASFNFFQCLVS